MPLYNAPLILSVDRDNPSERIIGFVDDTTLLASGKDLDETHSILKNMMERRNGVFDWSRTYNSPLEMNKLALVDFTHSHEKAKGVQPLTLTQPIGGINHIHQIKPSPNAKLLGVVLDERLSWSAQHERVREKAVKWTSAFRRYTKVTLGIRMIDARRLYNAVAVPRICYAADIWYHPRRANRTNTNPASSGPRNLTKRLESIQRQAAIAITGAMRSAPGDATIVHTGLTPMGSLLNEQRTKAYERLSAQPTYHPLHPPISRTARHPVKADPSALHHLAGQACFDPTRMEIIRPTGYRPGTQPTIPTYIAESKERAIEIDRESFGNGIKIYTDGSGYKGNIGAAAILYINSTKTDELRYQLGTDQQHTVYEGELTAIILGMHLAHQVASDQPDITINIDNQATIRTMNSTQQRSSQYLVDIVRGDIANLRDNTTPGPLRVVGMDRACRISRSIGTCDNEQSIVFVGARYKHVRIHEEYGPTYIPPAPARGTALGQSKRRVLVVHSNFRQGKFRHHPQLGGWPHGISRKRGNRQAGQGSS